MGAFFFKAFIHPQQVFLLTLTGNISNRFEFYLFLGDFILPHRVTFVDQMVNLRCAGRRTAATVRSLVSSSSSSAESEAAQPLRALFSAARSTGMEPWHATTSSDTPANHGAHLPDDRCGHALFPGRRQQRGGDIVRTPNLTTERGGQNGRKQREEQRRDYGLNACNRLVIL